MDRTESKLFGSKLQGIFESLAEEFARRPPHIESLTNSQAPTGEHVQVNSLRETLAGANLLFNLYPTPHVFYCFENSWAFLRALYGDKPLPRQLSERAIPYPFAP